MLKISAPGKLILSGEHAVVYGKPALSTTLNLRIKLILEKQTKNSIVVDLENNQYELLLPDIFDCTKNAQKKWQEFSQTQDQKILKQIIQEETDLLEIAIGETLLALGKDHLEHGFHLTIESQVPLGRGFGSSAAWAAVICGGFYAWFSGQINASKIEPLVHKVEQKIHGNPSGADGAVIVHGGSILFQKNHPIQFLPNLFSSFSQPIFIIDAGKPEHTTGEIVARVKEKYQHNQEKIEKVLSEIGYCTETIKTAFQTDNKKLLLNLINKNQQLLEQLGVVADNVRDFCQAIAQKGGAAKISGAGGITNQGGGIVICLGLAKKTTQELVEQFGFKLYAPVELGVEGLKIHD